MKKRGLLWGSIVGFANGFFASGGGIIAVLVLKKFFSLDEKKAHATSIAIILPLTLAGLIVYTVKGFSDMSVILRTGAGSAAGALLGAMLLSKLPSNYIRIGFGIVMVISSFRMFAG